MRLFFGPFTEPTTILHLEVKDWPNLLKTLEVFSSAGQARKNGWDKPIALGWSEARFKKARIVVFVLHSQPGKLNLFKRIREVLWGSNKSPTN